jgi:hypothetical protein
MKDRTREEPKIIAAAERKMHAWAMTAELGDRALESQTLARASPQVIKFVAISREAGAGGSEIGQRLGVRLGWRVFDRSLLDHIAQRFHLSRAMLDLVDETPGNWVYDVLGTWMDHQLVPHEKYFTCLCRVVLGEAQGGPAVFVGRGAQFILPRQQVLAVRLVASPTFRLRKIMERTGLTEAKARRCMRELDRGRREFAQRFFHRDITDSHLYNLLIDTERCGIQRAVEEIAVAIGPQAAPLPPILGGLTRGNVRNVH